MVKQLLKNDTQPVGLIFAGGDGTRLWPISTKDSPKQINSFFSKDTLVSEAYKRAEQLFHQQDIYVITTERIADRIISILKIDPNQVIVQPENVDTSAAIAISALILATKYRNPLAVVLYSDHLIANFPEFRTHLEQAIEASSDSSEILTIGTKPTSPNTHFGYIELGARTPKKHIWEIASFHEKPDYDDAVKFVASEEYLWNTGVYIWKPSVLLDKIKQLQPKMYQDLLELRISINSPDYPARIKEWYLKTPHESFEKAISEKLKKMYVYEARYGWIDVGNWKTIYELHAKDAHDNVILNPSLREVQCIDSEGCLVLTEAKKVAVVGMSNVIIIQHNDKLLVCHQDKAAEVKKAITSDWNE